MRTPEEIKKGLECGFFHECPYDDPELQTVEECARQVHKDALAYIQQLEDAIDKITQLMQSATEVIKKSQEQLESTYSQVKKALCGKENVSLVEVLEAADQLKSRLAQVERERDAAVADFTQFVNYGEHECKLCRHNEEVCLDCTWEWRGLK